MKLTQRTTATGVTLNDTFIHVVNTGDTSQDPTGSSYKAPLSLLSPLFTGSTGVSGSGTNNYVSKWTPDGTTLGDSLMQDDGSNMAIGSILGSTKFKITSDKTFGMGIQQTVNGIAAQFYSTTSGASSNIGLQTNTGGSSILNYGVQSLVNGTGTDESIGFVTTVSSGATNYSAQLRDGTEGIGKVFTCMTADGKANWANPVDARPYTSYVAIINQSGVGAPTVQILENTLGEVPTLSYDGVGSYSINTVSAVFTNSKTFIMCNQNDIYIDRRTVAKYGSATTVSLFSSVGTVLTDSIFSSCSLEIRVYN